MRSRLFIVVFVLAALSLACNMPGSAVVTPTGSSELITQVAGTLQALESPSATPAEVGLATAAPTFTATPSVTATFIPPANTPTVTIQPCDQAQFISDVTIPDGTKMVPGQAFTKTWRLRNLGSCTWNTNYALVFTSGEALSAPAVINLAGSVPTGGTVDVSVDMKAPAAPGEYKGNWKLRSPSGQVFGVQSDQPFFVQINVIPVTATVTPTLPPTLTNTITPPATGVIYNFITNVCSAEWLSKSGEPALTCPGTSGDSNGYVMRVINPTLETGAVETAGVLLTVPRSEANGVITGRYPSLKIENGYHFKATLGCLNGMLRCNVTYQLNYRIDGTLNNLGQWTQTYDSSIQGIDVDLSSLAGQAVELVLVVMAGDDADQDQAVWVEPRIVKQ